MTDMRRTIIYILSTALSLTVLSCAKRDAVDAPLLDYVSNALNDTSSVAYHVLDSWDASDKKGSIAVIGEPADVIPIVEGLYTSDHFNNIDGKSEPDWLPDFSGEIISSIVDEANSPYGGYVANGNAEYLRELTVKNFVSALDTSCLYSPYDKLVRVPKLSSKVVVIASPYAVKYGKSDIDTLCSLSGNPVPVVSAVHSSLRYALSRHSSGNFCMWTTPERKDDGLYAEPYREVSSSGETDFLVYAPDPYVELHRRLVDVLDLYIASGRSSSLSAIIVDDPAIVKDDLDKELAEILRSKDEASLPYRNLLANGFEFIFPYEAVSSECFAILRELNAFTHKIAFPVMKGYMSAVATELPVTSYQETDEFTSDYKFTRAVGSEIDTWFLIEIRNAYLSESLKEQMLRIAPKTYSIYVRE